MYNIYNEKYVIYILKLYVIVNNYHVKLKILYSKKFMSYLKKKAIFECLKNP